MRVEGKERTQSRQERERETTRRAQSFGTKIYQGIEEITSDKSKCLGDFSEWN